MTESSIPRPTRSGYVKIIGIGATDKHYGSNYHMKELVSTKKVYKYKTVSTTSKVVGRRIGYKVASWVWDAEDLIIVDSKGKPLKDDIVYPEPQKFNSKFLDI